MRNGLYKPKEFHGRGTKIVNMGEIFAYPRLGNVPMRRLELTEKERGKSLVKPGDLLFARRSLVAEGAGRCVLVTEAIEETVFESSIIRARPDPAKADSRYLHYFFASPIGRERMRGIVRQVAVAGITGTDLAEMQIELPALDQQKSVADFLTSLDDRIDLLRQTNSTLEAIAQALFKSWFVDFDPVRTKAEGREPEGMDAETAALFPSELEESELGLIPKGWRVVSFAETVNVIGGGTPKTSIPEYWGGDIPWFSVVDAPANGQVFTLTTEKSVTHQGIENSSARVLPAWTTIISARGTVGKLAMTAVPMAMNQSCYGMAPKVSGTEPLVYLAAQRLVDQLKRLAHGGVFDTITRDTLASILVVEPPVEAQLALADRLRPLFGRVQCNVSQTAEFSEIRDTLLPRLISGKLRLPEAESLIEESLA